ncbi:ATP synthase F1 subunit epsilon [Candidatus Saccharibacteria bacterium]|nr:ATP synthase F1 subunit epsilon [Candidatus Saccharibacteria bacterium]
MFNFRLVSLTGIQFEGQVTEVMLPTLDGEIGVLKGHMPLVSVAKTGIIAVRVNAKDRDDERDYFATNGGVIEVVDGELHVLVDEADSAEGISEADARAAYDRAQKMKAEAPDEVSLEHAQQLVDRHAVRLQVAGLKRRTKRH